MKRFKVRGTARGTGAKVKPLIIEAGSEREAVEEALSSGVQVTSVTELSAQEEADLPPGSVTRTRTVGASRDVEPAVRSPSHSAQLMAAVAPRHNVCRICGDKNLALRKIPRFGFLAACVGYLVALASIAVTGFSGWRWYQEIAAADMTWTFGPWSVATLVGVSWLIGGLMLTLSKRIIHCQRCRAAFDAW